MDKYNIISLTTDLDELKTDMARWCMLPYDLRMRSIDDCRRLYNGMSVIDLYNSLRETILKGQDIRETEPNNLVKESVSTEYDKYPELLAQSKELQQSPYIVILDPDINTIEELNNKYYSYYLLNDNNKQLSDTYSWKIWGRSIYSMYLTLAAQISYNDGEDEAESSNIVRESSLDVKNIEDGILPVGNFYNEAWLNFDEITMYKLRSHLYGVYENNIAASVLQYPIATQYDICTERQFDPSIFPTAVPWFTINEDYGKFIIDIEPEEYYKTIKESKSTDIGWNPSVEVNKESLEHARERQARYFQEHVQITNLENFEYPEDIEVKEHEKKYPIFLYFGSNAPRNPITNICNYRKLGIGFGTTTDRVYTFDGVDKDFCGFIPEHLSSYIFVDVFVVYVNKECYNRLLYTVQKEDQIEYARHCNRNSIFNILVNTKNILSPDNMKLICMRYLYQMVKVLNVDELPDGYKFADNIIIFKVFSGTTTEFRQSYESILNKLRILEDKTALNKVIESYTKGTINEGFNSDKEFLFKRLYPSESLVPMHCKEE